MLSICCHHNCCSSVSLWAAVTRPAVPPSVTCRWQLLCHPSLQLPLAPSIASPRLIAPFSHRVAFAPDVKRVLLPHLNTFSTVWHVLPRCFLPQQHPLPLPALSLDKRSQLPPEAKTFADSCLRSSAALFALLALFLYYCCVSHSSSPSLPPTLHLTFTLLLNGEAVQIPLKPVRANAFSKKKASQTKKKKLFSIVCANLKVNQLQ